MCGGGEAGEGDKVVEKGQAEGEEEEGLNKRLAPEPEQYAEVNS